MAGQLSATEHQEKDAGQHITMTADQLLQIADRAARIGDTQTSEAIYTALTRDPWVVVRSEARFRLAMLYADRERLSEAAVLLRAILDEQPQAPRVRLELARILDLIGDEGGARRALREAQAGGLPPQIAQFVDRYSAALRAQKPLGGSIEFALAPDSNINRATRSDTLGTVLGDFTLDEFAKEQSGIGASMRGQGYARLPVDEAINLFGRISGSADLFRSSEFNDLALTVAAGPELRLGADRLSIEAGGLWRWYGGQAYSQSATFAANFFHPLGRKAQLRATGNVLLVNNRINPLQDGTTYAAALAYERAVSSRAGFSISVRGERQGLRDPGYSNWSAQATMSGYREMGATTLFAIGSYTRLEADKRLLLFPLARSDHFYRGSLGASFRKFRIGTFAPFLRLSYEQNRSSIEIYDFNKVRSELGITRAF